MSDNKAAKSPDSIKIQSPDNEYKKKLNRIKSKICYYKKKPQCGGADAHKTKVIENDKERKEIIEKLETYRSILKLSEAKIKEFNRINKLIGRDEFNKDEFLNSIQI
ncbi:hypothetical protein TVAG_462820 [Trichomonas vaginalis G3]|uniref:Uncharacterized protein n=1 Tax=Trichomonas vaginalis (strain ATCC PRA-98 / G3) TaxID=412133 RepID=A2DLZ3_TRIV3|nr:hypothetical protein TVAGG3_0377850 [Trichomonas vaginalis G3]XP_001301763.1 hypothetical protein TVAGG3_0527820 [Trichomonas vaginalis G3]XP_001314200.1 hypothetical protein TVAGG3_0329100 [Trichomonas vaginalis G3]XP_001579582.1 hypothetical protein TVAGG3_1012780 [Trichomonas vaginalis G3]XP_051081286.1 hypothetical protein TVAGG3_1049250 [Trichomonas vaginalis G3]XP_051084363.1 hypothetical protein TVAGG3_0841900 [Trichomonas vaginalis G3]XP_051087119.1 hypothetical protein TVAGG3_0625|eukprot:XP_001282908.1 hypothetical protein [Trichomonas vaginalis G3]